jgi:DNA-directed RNA polymerase specialized sigma24 family protein
MQIEHAELDSGSREVARTVLYLSVDEIIQRQPESHRGIIRLRIDGLDVQSIAEREQRSKRTVERVLQSFRNQLMESALIDVGSEPS